MSTFRIYGPMCVESNPNVCSLDECTMCMQRSSVPLPLGIPTPFVPLRACVDSGVSTQDQGWEVLLLDVAEARKWIESYGLEAGKVVEARVAAGAEWVKNHKADTAKTGIPLLNDIREFVTKIYPAIKFGKVLTKTYNGQDYVILKGYPGMRDILTGTRYKATNPKVMDLAIGRAGLQQAAVKGLKLSLVVITAVDILQAFLSDDETLRKDLLFTLSVDITKAIITSVVVYGAELAAVAITGVAIVPVITGIIVGVVVGYALDKYFPTEKIAEAMRDWYDKMFARAQKALADAGQYISDAEDVWIEFSKSTGSVASKYFKSAEWNVMHMLSFQ